MFSRTGTGVVLSGQVRRLIQDPAYRGEGCWGRSTFVLGPNGRRLRRARSDGQEPLPIAYPPLVTPEEWHAAQAAGHSGRATTVRACADNYLLYGGMVRCREHGNVMSGSVAKQGTHSYRCKRRLYPGGTATHGVRARALEQAVWEPVQGAMLHSDLMVAAAERMAREAEEGMEAIARHKGETAARLATLAQQATSYFSEMREAGATAAEMATQIDLVREEESRLRAEMEQLDVATRLAPAWHLWYVERAAARDATRQARHGIVRHDVVPLA